MRLLGPVTNQPTGFPYFYSHSLFATGWLIGHTGPLLCRSDDDVELIVQTRVVQPARNRVQNNTV